MHTFIKSLTESPWIEDQSFPAHGSLVQFVLKTDRNPDRTNARIGAFDFPAFNCRGASWFMVDVECWRYC